jgi:hypothetical protein
MNLKNMEKQYCNNKVINEKQLLLKKMHKKDRQKYIRVLKRLLFETTSTCSDLSQLSLLSNSNNVSVNNSLEYIPKKHVNPQRLHF